MLWLLYVVVECYVVLCCEVFKLLYKYLVAVSEVVVGKSVVS